MTLYGLFRRSEHPSAKFCLCTHFICPNIESIVRLFISHFFYSKQITFFSFAFFFLFWFKSKKVMMDVHKEESVRKRKSAKSDNSPKKVRQNTTFDEDIDEIKKVLKKKVDICLEKEI